MATNSNFVVKNGLTVGTTNVIAANGVWVGANTNLIGPQGPNGADRSEEHTSELQSRFGISYAVF